MRAKPDASSPMSVALPTQGFRPFEPLVAPRDRADTYPRGRRCGFFTVHAHGVDECPTILNQYNPGPYCLLHAQKLESKILQEEQERLRRTVR